MPVAKTLIDSGPLVALFDSDDKYHAVVKKTLGRFSGELITTWPVLAEVTHLLSFSIAVQMDFLEWIRRGALTIENLESEDIDYVVARMQKYSDRPMDLADATLMCIAERNHLKHIFSIDADFSIYKTTKGKMLQNLLAKTH